MARWNEEQERWMADRGRREEHRRGGEWQGGREWDERGRDRWTSGDEGEEWRGGSRRDEWRGGGRGDEWRREQERWSRDREDEGRGDVRGEWDRERDRSGGRYRERLVHGEYGRDEGWGYGLPERRGGGASYGSGGMYGGPGGSYGGGPSVEGMRQRRHGGAGYGLGEYGVYDYGPAEGGDWRDTGRDFGGGGWRDSGRDFGRDLRRHGYGGERHDEGPLDRMGERMKEGWRKLTGRGPKGYKRSDERIREDVSERIARSGVNADEVEVKVEKAEVTLAGFVESREDKRMLEDLAEDVFGVDEVNNHLRVHRGEARGEARQTFTAGQSQTTGSAQGQGGAAGQGAQQRTSQGTQPHAGRT